MSGIASDWIARPSRSGAMKLLWRRYVCLAGLLAAATVANAQDRSGAAGAGAQAAVQDQRAGPVAGRVGDAGTTRRVMFWNNASIKAVQFDYVPPAAGEN